MKTLLYAIAGLLVWTGYIMPGLLCIFVATPAKDIQTKRAKGFFLVSITFFLASWYGFKASHWEVLEYMILLSMLLILVASGLMLRVVFDKKESTEPKKVQQN